MQMTPVSIIFQESHIHRLVIQNGCQFLIQRPPKLCKRHFDLKQVMTAFLYFKIGDIFVINTNKRHANDIIITLDDPKVGSGGPKSLSSPVYCKK